MSTETPSEVILRFGIFEVDLQAGELRKQGLRLRLQEQPFRVLSILLEHAGQVVTREELRARLWPADTFVDFDNSLNTSINKLREALGDSAESPRFIETLPRRGYRFVAPVTSKDRKRTGVEAAVIAAKPPTRKVAALVAVIVLATIVAALGRLWRSWNVQRLTEKDTIVLADFTNTTGNPVFDETLKQGLRVQLEQSPFLNILSDEKVGEQLRLMERPKDERLTPGLGREVCQRVGSRAVLVGSISKLGTHYVIGLNALNCQTGDYLSSEQVETDSKEHVLKALEASARHLREKLGESLATVQKYDVPIEQATTASLEALQAYSLGQKMWAIDGAPQALPLFKQAVELDPDFTMAYAKLGVAYTSLGNGAASVENTKKAYALRARVSEHERLYLESHYYEFATGELEKAAQVYELWRRLYPRDSIPPDNLVNIYATLGRIEKACQSAADKMRLDPNNVQSYHDLTWCYLTFNRLDEADALLRKAEALQIGEDFLAWHRFQLAFLRNDRSAMERIATEHKLYGLLALTEAYSGRLANARALWQRHAESKRQHDQFAGEGTFTEVGLVEALLGDVERAKKNIQGELNATLDPFTLGQAGLALALAGDSRDAEKVAADLGKKWPLDWSAQRYWLPIVRAAVALDHKDANRALASLAAVSPYEMSVLGRPFPGYLRGQAYLILQNGGAAATEFHKILDYPVPTLGVEHIACVLAHIDLGRAYALQGENAKAHAAYNDFFTLWKDADPDIPILKQAKGEYAKLQ